LVVEVEVLEALVLVVMVEVVHSKHHQILTLLLLVVGLEVLTTSKVMVVLQVQEVEVSWYML